MKKIFFLIILSIPLVCHSQTPDLILYNGNIFTGESSQKFCTAVCIDNGKITFTGSDTLLKLKDDKTRLIDLGGRFCMSGLIEGHGHMKGLGESLTTLNLLGTQSWEEILSSVEKIIPSLKKNELLTGRGWHQEKWNKLPDHLVSGYPRHMNLSELSPDNPVILYHASGHALLANARAMALAGISKNTADPEGGKIIKDERGEPTGIFEENAMNLFARLNMQVNNNFTLDSWNQIWQKKINAAQESCLQNGITSFQDAGATVRELSFYKKFADENKLKVRMWVMIHDSLKNIQKIANRLPVVGYHDDYLTVRAIKQYIDGALGSYGAWLLKPYTDKAGFYGQNVTNLYSLREFADFAFDHHMQLCVHAIGDRGNREVLNLFEAVFKRDKLKSDNRWRIEHAQHVNMKDIPRFAQLGVIASMQAIHCTSDAPFVAKRLGDERARNGSYAWRSLIGSGARLANGTDTPVEKLNPFECMYAALTRKRQDNGMEFYPEQKMTREETLLSYTLWNAYAGFEEDIKGSIKPGKLADLIILDTDLYHCADEKIPATKVLTTIINGEIVWERK